MWFRHMRATDPQMWGKTTATSRKRAEVAESKRRGEDAVDERLDGDALSDDTLDDELDVDTTDAATRDKPKRAGGVDKGGRTPGRLKVAEHPGIFARIRNFIREVISELGKVIWPTRKELLTYTTVVVIFVAIIMTIVGLLDTGFAYVVLKVFGNVKAK
jgi:preprotein translocase subunit SecE